MKRVLSFVLSIVMVFSLLSQAVFATEENINVKVCFDASVVAEDMEKLHSDLCAANVIDGSATALPPEITVSVPKGATVKEILLAAQAEESFTLVGINEGYITQVGYVGSDILRNLVSIPVGDYYVGNIFSSAGWSFYLDGNSLSEGIESATVLSDGAVLEGRFGLATGWDSNWNAIHYDEQFLDAYEKLSELVESEADESVLSEEAVARVSEIKESSRTLLSEIYNAASLNREVKESLKSAHSAFKTDGGMWIGYIESLGEGFCGSGSPTERLTEKAEALKLAMTPTQDDIISALCANIAERYKDTSGYWELIDLGAYEKIAPTGFAISDATKQSFVNTAIPEVLGSNKDADIAKAILAFTALGYDATKLYPAASSVPVSALDKLNEATLSTSAWSAPYTLAAYARSEYSARERELSLVKALIASQGENGAWDEFGTIDTTANVIAGLSFYANDEDESVKEKVCAAIEKALGYLSGEQNSDGTYSDLWSGKNSNTTAMVAIALAAAGVDAENDARFIKNGNTIKDGLLSFALEDRSGFGYTDNVSLNEYSTEQAFRALIALSASKKLSSAYNVYDFGNGALVPAKVKTYTPPAGGGVPSEPSEEGISVSVSVKAEKEYWLNGYEVKLSERELTVYHAFVKACAANGLSQTGAEKGYVSSISNGKETLSEREYGANSGWLYKVNGKMPIEGVKECEIKNGDSILFYYTKNYLLESGSGTWDDEEEPTNDKEETPSEETEKPSFADVPETHWASEYISKLAELGILNGRGNGFFPEDNITRAEFVTVLSRIFEEEFPQYSNKFSDVGEGAWYSQSVLWAYENGITNGVGADFFAPERNITREDMAVMIVRYAEAKGIMLSSETEEKIFSDEAQISGYAASAVKKMQSAGIISGLGGAFAPKRFATRAETAKMISCLLSAVEK